MVEIETPTPRQMAKIVKELLGPEEEWDDAAAEFVLRLHGIDPSRAPARVSELIQREIDTRTERGEEIPSTFVEVLSKFTSESELKEGPPEAKGWMEEMFIIGKVPIHSAAAQVHPAFHRRKKKLSKNDEKIIKELSDELIADDPGEQ